MHAPAKKSLLVFLLVMLQIMWPGIVRADDDSDNCSYPSPADRFGITVYDSDAIGNYDVSVLGAGGYLNWKADIAAPHPSDMRYLFMVRVHEAGYRPAPARLSVIAAANPGEIWLIGNEPDVMWQDNTSPASYVTAYHGAYHAIKAGDPTARVAIGGIV
ncbi:MAG: hypothetical protein ABTQ73_04655, partial [Caldilineales bacterium]